MSREGLADFLRAVDHHQGLRREAAQCSDDGQLLALARRHGILHHSAKRVLGYSQ